MIKGKECRKFSPETMQLLFTAVDEDDVVDESVSLPVVINLQCSQEDIKNNYALCIQHWEEGFTRRMLLGLILKVSGGAGLNEEERRQLKNIRSRYKHLRFAQRLYSKNHRSMFFFSKITMFLGRFQDAFRNDKTEEITFYSRLLRIYLTPPFWLWVKYSVRHVSLDSVSAFIHYRQQQILKLKALIASPQLTGKEFHTVRKIISQQVSYYDTLRAIKPADNEAREISRFLAAINGLMGDRHDEMVADSLSGRKSYKEKVSMDLDIRQRLELLVERYPVGQH
ncbi:hypothetical protein [Erwinia sorbitola]|uniref:CHAD domain-containing protein n=1 Tax=Erwinia sorbitola TaxID=2681984 RepID=A0A6I6EH86_9GAMM|nr:hypothetical protein [Erwinia sorbitola]QGU87275.1 hypothetical protein GN242_08650 [Erwinia sorbitola]